MQTQSTATNRYAKVVEVSKRVRWDIDRDVIRGRGFDPSRIHADRPVAGRRAGLPRRRRTKAVSQVQGRTYAYMFGLVERYIGAKAMELGRAHALGDQHAVEALVRMTDEEIKHQALFRRLEEMLAPRHAGRIRLRDRRPQRGRAGGARQEQVGRARADVAHRAVHAGALPRQHRAASEAVRAVEGRVPVPLARGVAARDPRRAGVACARTRELGAAERDAGVDDLIALVGAVDGILQRQAQADAAYFCAIAGTASATSSASASKPMLKAYRWQYIVSGAMEPRFQKTLFGCLDAAQAQRIQEALAPLAYAVPQRPEMTLPMAA